MATGRALAQIPVPSNFAGGSGPHSRRSSRTSDHGVSASEVNPEWALNARPTASTPDFPGTAADPHLRLAAVHAIVPARRERNESRRTTSTSTQPATYGAVSYELANMEMVEPAQRPAAVGCRHAPDGERLELRRPLGRERHAARSASGRHPGGGSFSVGLGSRAPRTIPSRCRGRPESTTTTTQLEGGTFIDEARRLPPGLRPAGRFLRGRAFGSPARRGNCG